MKKKKEWQPSDLKAKNHARNFCKRIKQGLSFFSQFDAQEIEPNQIHRNHLKFFTQLQVTPNWIHQEDLKIFREHISETSFEFLQTSFQILDELPITILDEFPRASSLM